MKQGFLWLGAIVAMITLTACRVPADGRSDDTAAMELKIYAAPAAQTANLAGALGLALGKRANVTMPAPGKLLVYAPRDAQASIAAVLDNLKQDTYAKQLTVQVDLRFWIIGAKAGNGTDDDSLKPLSATLATLRRTMGPIHFHLEQSASAMAASGRSGKLVMATEGGSQRGFDFKLGTASPEAIELSLEYADAGPGGLRQFSTQVGARFGQYLVLAQAPGACPVVLTSGKRSSSCPDEAGLQLLVVRVDRIEPHA